VEGWSKLSRHDLVDLAQHFEIDGVHSIIYTDISRDGMMSGVNIEATKKLAESVRIPVIASGGVTNLDDLKQVKELEDSGVEGVITGRAIYEGSLDFKEGQALLDQ
jgi:phosphoribosylformimino-5-aminoimidazole carboxamide ribotide isomerase